MSPVQQKIIVPGPDEGAHVKEAQQQTISKCEICNNIAPQYFCWDCEQSLCAVCKDTHGKFAGTRCHKIVDIGERPSEEELAKKKKRAEANICDKHKGEELKLYCCECKMLLCCFCLASEHNKQHEGIMQVSKVAESKCEILENDKTRIESCIEKTRSTLKDASKEYKKEISKVKKNTESSVLEVKNYLSKQEANLLQALEAIEKAEENALNDHDDNGLSKFAKTKLNNFVTKSKMMLKKEAFCEIIRAADELQNEAEQLVKSEEELNSADLNKKKLKTLEHLTSTIKELKTSVLSTELDQILVVTEKFLKHLSFKEIELDNPITGVTEMDDKIYLIQFGQTEVKVYDSKELKEQKSITVPDMTGPRGLVGCPKQKYLYIIDNRQHCIHRIKLTDSNFKKWKITYPNPRGLSMTLEHNILVTICSDIQSRVLEYSPEGELIKDIALNRSIQEAYQIIQLSADRFIICHGEKCDPHRICVLNPDLKIVKSYGREKGGGEDQLHNPRSLALDHSTGILFVADQVNNRVLMFDKNLNLLGQVQMPSDDLLNPSRLYFDPRSARLFVGDAKHHVFIIGAVGQ